MKRNWEAESDAHTLISAKKIQGDRKRFGKAKRALATIEKEASATLDTAKAVRGGKMKNHKRNLG